MLKIDRFTLIFRCIATALSVLCILFIFSNSFDSGSESTKKSEGVTEVVQEVVDVVSPGTTVSEGSVRTYAHFFEFMLLGFLLLISLRSYTPHIFKHCTVAPFTGMVVAVADETIQKYSEQRAAEVADVIVDTLGALSGIAVAYGMILLITYILKRKKQTV